MASKTEVGAAAVRTWFQGLAEADRFLTRKGAEPVALSIGQRGKLSQDVIEAFEKANKGKKYTPGFVEARKITGVRQDANGRNRSVTISARNAEIRAWAQSPEGIAAGAKAGERGIIAKETVALFVARPVAAKAPKAVKAEAVAVSEAEGASVTA